MFNLNSAVAGPETVQVAKSTKYFELFGGLNPGTVRVSTENSKDKVILVICAIFGPATAEFRIMAILCGYARAVLAFLTEWVTENPFSVSARAGHLRSRGVSAAN